MVTTTINYIVYTAGHRRHHGGSQTQLIPQAVGVATAGDNLTVPAFSSLPYNEATLPFAFMSVVGASDGSKLFTSPGTQNISVGDTDIRVLVVYAPAGGGDGHGGPGVWVDAFNVNAGEFSDSDFMQVFTDGIPDAAKTATANNDGIVSSATAEDLRSFTSVDGVPFLEWQKIGGSITSSLDYNLQVNEGGLVFAFYQTPEAIKPPKVNVPAEGWIFVSPGVLIDAGGFVVGPDGPHPVDPLKILASKLLSTVALISLSSNMDEKVRASALTLAEDHLTSIARSIKTTNFETGNISVRTVSNQPIK